MHLGPQGIGQAGSDKVDTGEADEVIDAIAKTVAELTNLHPDQADAGARAVDDQPAGRPGRPPGTTSSGGFSSARSSPATAASASRSTLSRFGDVHLADLCQDRRRCGRPELRRGDQLSGVGAEDVDDRVLSDPADSDDVGSARQHEGERQASRRHHRPDAQPEGPAAGGLWHRPGGSRRLRLQLLRAHQYRGER